MFGRLRGDWHAALTQALELEAAMDTSARFTLAEVRVEIAHLRLDQGDLVEAERLLDLLPEDVHAFVTTGAAVVRAQLHLHRRDLLAARASLQSLEPSIRNQTVAFVSPSDLPLIARTGVEAGVPELVDPLLHPGDTARPLDTCTALVLGGLMAERSGRLEEAESRLADAAGAWSAFGDPWQTALARRDRGRCLARLGRRGEAEAPLEEARQVFARLGARPALASVGALLLEACR
jgi:hypothetical protein